MLFGWIRTKINLGGGPFWIGLLNSSGFTVVGLYTHGNTRIRFSYAAIITGLLSNCTGSGMSCSCRYTNFLTS